MHLSLPLSAFSVFAAAFYLPIGHQSMRNSPGNNPLPDHRFSFRYIDIFHTQLTFIFLKNDIFLIVGDQRSIQGYRFGAIHFPNRQVPVVP